MKFTFLLSISVQHGNKLLAHLATKRIYDDSSAEQRRQEFCRDALHAVRHVRVDYDSQESPRLLPRALP